MNTQSTILVVEDDPAILFATQRTLEQAGYATFGAPDGETALALVSEHKPNLVLLDVNLPGINGFEVCRRIKADPALASVYVVMVSGTHVDANSKVNGLKIGADDYLTRPISNRELEARIRAMLRIHAAESDLRASVVQWSTTFDAVGDAIFLTDANYTILKRNRAAAEMWQIPLEALIEKKCYQVMHGTGTPASTCPLAMAREAKHRQALAFTHNERWLEAKVDPIFDANGNFTGTVHVITDITERVRTEAVRQQAEEANKAHIHFLESLEQIDRVIRQETDIEQMIKNGLEKVQVIFNCDRAWLFYPCDPDAPTFRVPMEVSRPEYPGANILNQEVPMDLSVAKDLRDALASEDPIPYTLGTEKPVNTLTAQQFAVQAQMFMAIYPKIGKPWVFGMHQCSHARIWTDAEKALFKEIGRRVADGLSTMLIFRDLRESEEHFRSIFTAMDEGVVFRNKSGEITAVNPAAERILGLAAVKMSGQTSENRTQEAGIIQVDGSKYPGELHPAMITLRTGKPQSNVVMGIHRPDGTLVWISMNSQPLILNEETEPSAVVTTFRDITERKRAEQVLRASEARFSTAFYSSPIAVAIYRLSDRRIVDVNDVFVKTVGYPRDEIIGHTTDELHLYADPEDRNRIGQILRERASLDNFEFGIRRKSGEVRIVLDSARLIDIGEEKHFLSSLLDITERRQAEKTLAESERRYRELFENASMAIFQSTPDGKVILVNPEFARMFGYESPKDVAATVRDVGADLFADPQRRAEIVRLKAEHPDLNEFENLYRRKDGSTFVGKLHIHSVMDSDGRMLYFEGFIEDITERKRAEEALRAASSYNRRLIEASLDPLVTIGPNGKITDVNGATEQATGISRERLIGSDFSDYFTEPEEARIGYQRVLLQGLVRDYPLSIQHASGGTIDVLYNAVVYENADGQVEGVFAAARDITVQKKAEDALHHYAMIVESSEDAIISNSLEGTILTWNKGAEKIYGYSADEIVGRSVFLLVSPEYSNDMGKILAQIANGNLIDQYEIVHMRKDGQRIDVALTVSLVKDATGRIVSASTIARDITERKRADEALRISEGRYRMAQAMGHVGNWEYNLQTNEFWGSDEAKRIYGFDLKQPNFTTDEVENCIPERERIHQALVDLIEADKPYNLEFEIHPKNSSKSRIISSVAELKRDKHGNPLFVLGVIQDITERKRAEEEICQLNAELEQRVEARTNELREAQEQLVRQEKLAVLGQLAGGVGHELRNPLTVINNAVYFLKLVQPDANPKIKEYLQIIESETHTAEKIITDLLDFARIKSVDRKPVAVSELVGRVLARYPAPEAVMVSLDLPANLPNINVDPHQMEQVLGNLVVNACQAMAEGGALTISARRRKKMVAICVKDTGVGITPENMRKLFEPLFTTKAKGIGLGLAVSKKLVEANGGQIEVESEPGKGSVFTVYLPAAKEMV